MFFGSAASLSFIARRPRRPAPARQLAAHAALELGALAGVQRASRLLQASRAALPRAAGRAPGARGYRRALRTAAQSQPSFLRAPAISSAPSGEPCDFRVARLGRRAEADRGLAGDQGRPVGFLRRVDRGGNRLRIVAVDALAAQPAASKRFTWSTRVGKRQRRRRSRCRCRRTARSAG